MRDVVNPDKMQVGSTIATPDMPPRARPKDSPDATKHPERARTLVRFALRTALGGPLDVETVDQMAARSTKRCATWKN